MGANLAFPISPVASDQIRGISVTATLPPSTPAERITSTAEVVLPETAGVDLHLHTVVSDGRWTPEGLIEAVAAAGVSLCAITDHDSTEGIAPTQRKGNDVGVHVLPGIEFTADFQGQLLHLLAYGIDPADPGLRVLLADVQDREHQRAWGMVERLRGQRLVEFSADEVARLQAEPRLTQAKLVRLLSDRGLDSPATYRPLLLQVMQAPFCTTSVEDIAGVLRPQGCPLIVAHPGSGMPEYAPVIQSLTHDGLVALLDNGLIDGVEVHHPRHTPEMVATYTDLVTSRGRLKSAGSDSHSAASPPRPHPVGWCRDLLQQTNVAIGSPE